AFQDYLADFQQRVAHDRDFPDEPKQVLPGENSKRDLPKPITSQDGLVEIVGTTATMAVNERLLPMLLQKNPELSFALEESFPLKSTYTDATLLGPITDIRARDPHNDLTPVPATQSIEYCRSLADQ